MTRTKGEPAAYASLRTLPGSRVRLWVVEQCPLCGEQHFHTAGSPDADPQARLGSMPAPCDAGRTYRLSELVKPRREDRKAARRQARREARRADRQDDEW